MAGEQTFVRVCTDLLLQEELESGQGVGRCDRDITGEKEKGVGVGVGKVEQERVGEERIDLHR